MWIGVQATVTCAACGSRTAANAAVTRLVCDDCGADLSLLPEFWRSVLRRAGDKAAELDAYATAPLSYEQAGTKIRLRISRTGAHCPHCSASLPEATPAVDLACAECDEVLGVRRPPGGATDSVAWLVAEDRRLLAGQARLDSTPESLCCPNCGGPVLADGTRRRLPCGACGSEVLVPDEVWRRVHAPTAVATWYLWSPVGGSTGLTQDLSVAELCVGRGGRLYALGSYDDQDLLMALDTDPMRLVWTRPVPTDGEPDVLASIGDELWWGDLRSPTVRRLDAATGEDLGAFEVAETPGVRAFVDMGDGTVVVHAYPSERLERVASDGQPRPLWPAEGLLSKLLGGDRGGMALQKPVARPGAVHLGRVGRSWGGGLCLATTKSGVMVARLDAAGKLVWTAALADVVAIESSPQATPDGAVFVVGLGGDGARLLRISPDGKEVRTVQADTFDGAEDSWKGVNLFRAAMAVDPAGDVWLAGSGGVERYDGQGKLRWFWHAE